MAKGILWAVASLAAAMALVAGCINVDVPEGPYVKLDNGSRAPTAQSRNAVSGMDRATLENEYLRLAAENSRLRQEVAKLKREKDVLEERVDVLEDRIDDMKR
jgi:hypothetical protein